MDAVQQLRDGADLGACEAARGHICEQTDDIQEAVWGALLSIVDDQAKNLASYANGSGG